MSAVTITFSEEAKRKKEEKEAAAIIHNTKRHICSEEAVSGLFDEFVSWTYSLLSQTLQRKRQERRTSNGKKHSSVCAFSCVMCCDGPDNVTWSSTFA